MSYADDGVHDDTDVRLATVLCERLHAGQLDQVGDPYADHLKRVADQMDTPTAKVVALLQDVTERTALGSLNVVEALFGDDVARTVGLLTYIPGTDRARYYALVRTSQVAWQVKRATVIDNLDPDRLAVLPSSRRERLRLRHTAALLALGDAPQGVGR